MSFISFKMGAGFLMGRFKWLYYSLAAVVVVSGIVLAVYFGANPRSLPKISFSHFESPEDFGINIYKRLRLEVNSHHLLFLGVQPDSQDHYKVWKAFLNSIDVEHRFDTIIVDKSLGDNVEIIANEVISMESNPMSIVEGVKNILSTKKRVAIIAPTSFLSYSIRNNFQTLLRNSIYGNKEKVYDVDWLSFSLSPFANTKADESLIPFPCNTTPHDSDGSSDLGCLILTKSKINYRKPRVLNKYPGMLDQIGTKEYLALLGKKNI